MAKLTPVPAVVAPVPEPSRRRRTRAGVFASPVPAPEAEGLGSPSRAAPSSAVPSSAVSLRERLVRRVAEVLGHVPLEHHLRCVPVHRRVRASSEPELVEWRAVLQADEREWYAAGPTRDAALRGLEEALAKRSPR